MLSQLLATYKPAKKKSTPQEETSPCGVPSANVNILLTYSCYSTDLSDSTMLIFFKRKCMIQLTITAKSAGIAAPST